MTCNEKKAQRKYVKIKPGMTDSSCLKLCYMYNTCLKVAFFKIGLKCILCTFCRPYPFKEYSSVVLSSFSLLCNQYSELFSSCKTETLYPMNSNLPLPLPQPQAGTIYVLSLRIWLFHVPRISGILQHLSFVTGSFHIAYALKVHPCCSMNQESISLCE